MSFFVYFARCTDDTLYCGYCKDLAEREAAHNAGTGAKYTRARGPVKMVYAETFDTKPEAMKREYVLKQISKTDKENLIKRSPLNASAPEK